MGICFSCPGQDVDSTVCHVHLGDLTPGLKIFITGIKSVAVRLAFLPSCWGRSFKGMTPLLCVFVLSLATLTCGSPRRSPLESLLWLCSGSALLSAGIDHSGCCWRHGVCPAPQTDGVPPTARVNIRTFSYVLGPGKIPAMIVCL